MMRLTAARRYLGRTNKLSHRGPSKTIEDTYEKMTPREHILFRPDMYVGTLQRVQEGNWVFDEKKQKMVWIECSYIPGMYKIFDEIIVNSADNKSRDPTQTLIDVTVNEETGEISVMNNGNGIPIAKHKKYDMWVPEMIFGHLLTSSNYNDDEDRTTGGRYGYGAKLTNIFSTNFTVETVNNGKRFTLSWEKNMSKMGKPEIKDVKSDDYTRITFTPDYEKLSMPKGLASGDIFDIIRRRVIDMAGMADGMKVTFNKVLIPVKNFEEYCALYPGDLKSSCHMKISERMELNLRTSADGFQHVSFVNSISTVKGGSHVQNVVDQVVEKVTAAVKKVDKTIADKTAADMVKNFLWVFVRHNVSNPSFDSQQKQCLRTRVEEFGGKQAMHTIPGHFVDSFIEASGIVEKVIQAHADKFAKKMGTGAQKQANRLLGIAKLDDASLAGSARSSECTLILTEGDSAKSLAVSGLGIIGRDTYGVFPLRGKLLNVRNASMKIISDCEEVQNVMKILGMRVGETSVDNLRYGHVMIMADQDLDGIHIKGLITNMIHHLCPAIFQRNNFLSQFITPIVKAFKNKEVKSFYSMNDFEKFSTNPANTGYRYKYYKGLGTSTSAEAKEYFSDMKKHKIKFQYVNQDDEKALVLAFDKNLIEERKKWITQYTTSALHEHVDLKAGVMRYHDFIHKDLIKYSIADCQRSLPSMLDGFKPGQRKILFGCFLRKLHEAVKVSQLSGFISERASYHHGEASLQMTIVNMAQDFVGSNNISLLVPDGQFGTRLQGGKDSASARYIFTKLDEIARLVFPEADDADLKRNYDDGLPVEPETYLPVIPMVLANGVSGIGTGFATNSANYNPRDLIKAIRQLFDDKKLTPLSPWYRGFLGTISVNGDGHVVTRGVFKVISNNHVNISELPVGEWTSTYKVFLERLIEEKIVHTIREHHTDSEVDFDVYFQPDVLELIIQNNAVGDVLNLTQKLITLHFIMFDENGSLKEYANPEEIIKAFYAVRLRQYDIRKQSQLTVLAKHRKILKSKRDFIKAVNTGTLKLQQPVAALEAQLAKAGYPIHHDSGDYAYLLDMRIATLTSERVAALDKMYEDTTQEIALLEGMTAKTLWENDLVNLEHAIKKQNVPVRRVSNVGRRSHPSFKRASRGEGSTIEETLKAVESLIQKKKKGLFSQPDGK